MSAEAEKTKERQFIVRQMAAMLEEFPESREKYLAVTKLEECIMWMSKAIRKLSNEAKHHCNQENK